MSLFYPSGITQPRKKYGAISPSPYKFRDGGSLHNRTLHTDSWTLG